MSNESYSGHTDLSSLILFHNEAKGIQYRLTISVFRDNLYLGLREWYQEFEGDYAPTRNGVTMPYNIFTTARLYSGLRSCLSTAETLTEVEKEATELDRLKLEWYNKHVGIDPRTVLILDPIKVTVDERTNEEF